MNEQETVTRQEGARVMGGARSERKAQAARENGAKSTSEGRPPWPLEAYACTCGAGDVVERHRTTCPRGRAIRRRQKAGKLPIWEEIDL